jgi:hypothetical protein
MRPVYLTTDLEIRARLDLQPLLSALEKGGVHGALKWRNGVCRLNCNGPVWRRPSTDIEAMLNVVESLEPEHLELWSAAIARRFIVGVGYSDEPFNWTHTAYTLPPHVMKRLAATDSTFVMYVYRPDQNWGSRSVST